jgi:delta 1-pyrroline-5-carboxylate dehydrogenase
MSVPRGWTLDTLKALMDERDRRYGEVSAAKEEAVKIALADAEKAVSVAERNAEKWRDNANEWRAAMTDRERMFLHKNMGIVIAFLSGVALLLAIAEKFLQ